MKLYKVVVTGASGFIGGALVKKLRLLKDFEVIPVSRSKVDQPYLHVSDYNEAPFGDILIHFAEHSNRQFINNSDESVIVNAEKTLDELLEKKYNNVIYCSSSVVYGDIGIEPFIEETLVTPYDRYTLMKINNENRVLNAGGIVARLTNVIGQNMSKNNVLSDIFSQTLKNGPLYVQNDRPIRDFIALDDVVNALIMMVINGGSGIYNIGSGIGVSIKELAEMVLKTVDQETRPVKSIKNITSHSYNVVKIEKIKKMYKWNPKLTLKQSIVKLL